jgi:rhodanese-related sulfurtransferase
LIPQLAPADLARWRADSSGEAPVLVDVREPLEFALCKIDGSLTIRA